MMKQTNPRKAKKPNTTPSKPPLNLFYALIIGLYGIITVITPNLMTLDSLGPKFLSLALLNLLAYFFLIFRKDMKMNADPQWHFFRNLTGIVYLLFLLVALLSFFKAINILESILNFAKLFTIFSAAYIVSIILRIDRRYLYPLAVVMCFLLIIDAASVFYHVLSAVADGQAPSIYNIKSVYSNKNILSAALFVKMPFALWFVAFEKKWLKLLGMLTIVVAAIATLVMSTRTFYLGLIFLTLFYLIFMGIRYYKKNESRRIVYLLAAVVTTVVIVFTGYNVLQKMFFPSDPEARDAYTVGFIERLKTIAQGEAGRTAGWKRSFKLIEEHPLLGVGTGNWKIEVLKYENLTSKDYIYMYKAHNDFVETTAETGIFGGLLYLSIYLLIILNFVVAFFQRGAREEQYKYLFFAAFGIFCYSFDAFFNFPADRPEICSLFAIYVGAGIAFSGKAKADLGRFFRQAPMASATGESAGTLAGRPAWRISTGMSLPLNLAMTLILTGSAYILYQNFLSLRLQRIIKDEQISGIMATPSEVFLTQFPWIPDINVQGEPIAVQKARYLVHEKKFRETIDLLKQDKSSPYDTRPEFFIGTCYANIGQMDSAMVYYQKVYKQKPNFSNNVTNMTVALEGKGKLEEALAILEPFRDDQAIKERKRDLQSKIRIRRVEKDFYTAVNAYTSKNFNEAVKYFTRALEKEPDLVEAYDMRAFCYFFLKDIDKSLSDIENAFSRGLYKANLYNLRGVLFQSLGRQEESCRDFNTAREMGDKDGVQNFDRFCLNTKK